MAKQIKYTYDELMGLSDDELYSLDVELLMNWLKIPLNNALFNEYERVIKSTNINEYILKDAGETKSRDEVMNALINLVKLKLRKMSLVKCLEPVDWKSYSNMKSRIPKLIYSKFEAKPKELDNSIKFLKGMKVDYNKEEKKPKKE